jgi:hypothetical protein
VDGCDPVLGGFPHLVEVLSVSCSQDSSVESPAFESDSHFLRIEEKCFSHSVIRAVHIPDSAEVLGKYCFHYSKIETITFETNSNLKRIGQGCFEHSFLKSIVIPRSVLVIGGECFMRYAQLAFGEFEHDAQLKELGSSGTSSEAFVGMGIQALNSSVTWNNSELCAAPQRSLVETLIARKSATSSLYSRGFTDLRFPVNSGHSPK